MAGKPKKANGTQDVFADFEFYLRYLKSQGLREVPRSEAVESLLTGRAAAPKRAKLPDGTPPPDDPTYFEQPWHAPDEAISLAGIGAHLGDCRRCKLHQTRQNIVFGNGNPHAELVFVGEAPGADEDAKGEPFVGRAGKLLDRMIQAMGKTRADVFICNVLKCRPPKNRDPEADEVLACEPFLIKQIEALAPRVICALGAHAAKTLLKTNMPIGRMRGRFHEYQGVKLLPTYHPAYLLRDPSMKKPAWEDLQLAMAELGWPLPEKTK